MTTDPPKLAQLRTLPRNFCPLQDPRLDKPIAISRLTMEAEEAAPIAPVTAMAAMEATAVPAAEAQSTSSHLTSLSASRLKISTSSSRLTLWFSTKLDVVCFRKSSRMSTLSNRQPLLKLKPKPTLSQPQRLAKTRFSPLALSMSCSISCQMS